jgi:hypothetical protein
MGYVTSPASLIEFGRTFANADTEAAWLGYQAAERAAVRRCVETFGKSMTMHEGINKVRSTYPEHFSGE